MVNIKKIYNSPPYRESEKWKGIYHGTYLGSTNSARALLPSYSLHQSNDAPAAQCSPSHLLAGNEHLPPGGDRSHPGADQERFSKAHHEEQQHKED